MNTRMKKKVVSREVKNLIKSINAEVKHPSDFVVCKISPKRHMSYYSNEVLVKTCKRVSQEINCPIVFVADGNVDILTKEEYIDYLKRELERLSAPSLTVNKLLLAPMDADDFLMQN